jgi:hypothetical protein
VTTRFTVVPVNPTSVNRPCGFVRVPTDVRSARTTASGSGRPVSESMTTPLIVPVCPLADATGASHASIERRMPLLTTARATVLTTVGIARCS